MCVYILDIFTYIHTHTERERERERDLRPHPPLQIVHVSNSCLPCRMPPAARGCVEACSRPPAVALASKTQQQPEVLGWVGGSRG